MKAATGGNAVRAKGAMARKIRKDTNTAAPAMHQWRLSADSVDRKAELLSAELSKECGVVPNAASPLQSLPTPRVPL
jgi:hypothetical protein